jgi:hypothetical protein
MALGRLLPTAPEVIRAAHEALDGGDWEFLDALRFQRRFDLSRMTPLERFLMTRWDTQGANPAQELFRFTPEGLAAVCTFAVGRNETDSIAQTLQKTRLRLWLPPVKREKWDAIIVDGQLRTFLKHGLG